MHKKKTAPIISTPLHKAYTMMMTHAGTTRGDKYEKKKKEKNRVTIEKKKTEQSQEAKSRKSTVLVHSGRDNPQDPKNFPV